MALEPAAMVIDEGIVFRPIHVSSSDLKPTPENSIRVLYYLTDRNETLIDENISSDESFLLPLRRLIRCWQIALTKITLGSIYKVSCPSDTAYGDKGNKDGVIKPAAALTFRITLLGVE